MSKNLVLFYSKSGKSKKTAELLAETLSCETAEIISEKKYSGPIGFLSAGKSSMTGETGDIKEPAINPADYDAIILCSPIWAGLISTPARTWLERHCSECKSLAFILTSAGGNSPNAPKKIAEITKSEYKLLEIGSSSFKDGSWKEKVQTFSKEL